jgi:predicted DNA-binding transcriptional regulator AlpA
MRTLPTEVTNFSDLPDEAHIRLNVMKFLYGCSGSTIWRSVKAKRIPEPHHLAERITCWKVGEVRAALAKYDK